MSKNPSIEIIVLAAGLGSRMKSEIPKVLHPVCGQPMIVRLLTQILQASERFRIHTINIVVGHGRDQVEACIKKFLNDTKASVNIRFSHQKEQKGTAHAVSCALEQSDGEANWTAIFNGDLPLYSHQSFSQFLDAHLKLKSSASLVSSKLEDAGAYGRVLRKGKNFTGVKEFKDANAAEKRIQEFNGGIYLFETSLLKEAISKIGNKNASNEFYLPDVFRFALKKKKRIYAHCMSEVDQIRGVNTMEELSVAQKILYLKTAQKWMNEGVFIHEPASTWIGTDVKFAKGCVVYPFARIHGESVLGEGVVIGQNCDLTNVRIGNHTNVRNGTFAEKAIVGSRCSVGPMAHLRPGTVLKDDVRVGNFVEIKESTLGEHTNAAHLSYIGDAKIGAHVNLGCGFVTCNYDGLVRDGKRKHSTVIGNHVFVGSDSQVVAPIQIADGCFIASGSTVTDSVEQENSLILARSKQITKPGYAKKYKSDK